MQSTESINSQAFHCTWGRYKYLHLRKAAVKITHALFWKHLWNGSCSLQWYKMECMSGDSNVMLEICFTQSQEGRLYRVISTIISGTESGPQMILHPCCSVAQSCLTLRSHGLQHASFPVLHHLLEFAQTRVHWIDEAIQPSHALHLPLLLPSTFPSISLFQWVSALHQVAKVLELQLQLQPFQSILRVGFL